MPAANKRGAAKPEPTLLDALNSDSVLACIRQVGEWDLREYLQLALVGHSTAQFVEFVCRPAAESGEID